MKQIILKFSQKIIKAHRVIKNYYFKVGANQMLIMSLHTTLVYKKTNGNLWKNHKAHPYTARGKKFKVANI